MTEDEKKCKQKREKLTNILTTCKISLRSVEGILNRFNRIKDPVLKFSMLTQILAMVIEIATNAGITFIEEAARNIGDGPEASKLAEEQLHMVTKVEDMREEISKFFDQMTEWISTPVFSPDHPYGAALMTVCKESHDKNHNNIKEMREEPKE